MGEFDEIIGEFLAESYEGLELVANDLVALEKDPNDKEILARIFRALHTIKGTCGFLEFKKLESLSHAGETLLSKMRDGRIVLDATITDALLALSDAAREFLDEIGETGAEGDGDYSALTVRLEQLAAGPDQRAGISGGDEAARAPASEGRAAGAGAGTGPSPPAAAARLPAKTTPSKKVATRGGGIPDQAIRIDVRVLDKLMNLVGELVLIRNRLLQFDAFHQDRALAGTVGQLNLITSELQEAVTRTRLQPIGTMWRSYGRLVRDLSSSVGKKARIEMEGAETELDRNILQAIKDPITHLIRNAIDHGVEPAAIREAQGKPSVALIHLRASHEGGQVNIDISDDGAGLDLPKIREQAINKGLVSLEALGRMDDSTVANLVFLPGFSTAASVTSISGRGVGMDVVKTNIEEIGGTVELSTRAGHGTNARLQIPLTLAIIPALFVRLGETLFAVPQSSVVELVRPRSDRGREHVELLHGSPVYRLRGKLLPLIFLARELGLDSRSPEELAGASPHLTIVVFRAEGQEFGLVVDHICNTREVVVKSLGAVLKDIGVFSGATVRGDGKVSLILDLGQLADRAGVLADSGRAIRATGAAPVEVSVPDQMDEMLVVKGQGNSQMGIMLAGIKRLEEFALARIEKTGGRQVVQYRGDVLVLIPLDVLLSERRKEHRESGDSNDPHLTCQVVICQYKSQEVGLVTEGVVEIIGVDPANMGKATRKGTLGTVVISDRITEVLDLDRLLLSAVEQDLLLPEATAQI